MHSWNVVTTAHEAEWPFRSFACSSFQTQSIFSASSPIFFHSPWKNLFMSYETIWTVDILYEIWKNMECSREWEVIQGERMFMNTMETESWIYLATSLTRYAVLNFQNRFVFCFHAIPWSSGYLSSLLDRKLNCEQSKLCDSRKCKMCGSTDTSAAAGSCTREKFFLKKKSIDTRPILAEPSTFFSCCYEWPQDVVYNSSKVQLASFADYLKNRHCTNRSHWIVIFLLVHCSYFSFAVWKHELCVDGTSSRRH